MNSIVLLTLSVLAVLCPAYAQFGLNFDECPSGKLTLDPFLMQALKSKTPKKYSTKLEIAKDLQAFDTKYKLQAAKLLARHFKNLNPGNFDLQNLMYQTQQPGLVQPGLLQQGLIQQGMVQPGLGQQVVTMPDCNQAALMAQQQQQQQLAALQLPIDFSRGLTLTSQPDSCYSQLTDPRYQQATLQLTGAQRYGDLQDISRPCTKCQCSCEEEEPNTRSTPDGFTTMLSSFMGLLKNILK